LIGTGKTLLAKAVAGEAKAAFLPIGPSDILSKYVGESEAAVRTIFAKAVGMAKQVDSRVAVIFFDEIDALGHSRGPNDSHDSSSGGGLGSRISSGGDLCSRRVLAELLIQLSRINCSDTNLEEEEDKRDESPQEDSSQAEFNSPGFDSGNAAESLDSHVFDSACHEEGDSGSIDMSHVDENSIGDQKQVRLFVLAATNRPEDCDPALLRRFGIQLKVGLPHSKDRIALLKHYLKEVEHTITDQDFSKLALATKGCSGSELESLTRESVMAPVRECIREAAAVGRRFMKQHLQAGGDSSDNVGQLRAQIYLEEEIVHLRPVMLYDYVDAIKFWRNQLLVHSTNHTALPLARLGYGDERRLESLGSGSEEDE
jgi:SpoVK/Ycf46/Vps4 family AAA+-type ATPase